MANDKDLFVLLEPADLRLEALDLGELFTGWLEDARQSLIERLRMLHQAGVASNG